ncbi:MAG TPA: hypothetical protein VGR56_02720 [Nitrososphaerales archaeon]|nr:hypothetical protein [Nitrososphaerales archaeon]
MSKIRSYTDARVKRDPKIVQSLLMAGFSRETPSPENLAIMAPTSEGKTWPITNTLSLFEKVTFFSGSTAKSIFYKRGVLIDKRNNMPITDRLDELSAVLDSDSSRPDAKREAKKELRDLRENSAVLVDLNGLIMVWLDAPPRHLFDAMKPLLSHDAFESDYDTVNKGGRAGRNSTETIRLRGWPVCVFASARNEENWEVWPEIRTRFNVISPVMDPAKYLEANQLSGRLRGLPTFILKDEFPDELADQAKAEVKEIEERIRGLRVAQGEPRGSNLLNLTFNPFEEWLSQSFPHDQGDRMRYYKYLLNYINISSLVNLADRPLLRKDGNVKAIVVCWPDVELGLSLVAENLKTILPPHKLAFFNEYILGCGCDPFKVSDILDWAVKWGRPTYGRSSIAKTYLEPFEEAGLIESRPNPDDKRSLVYDLKAKEPQESRQIAIRDDSTEIMAKEALSGLLQNRAGLSVIKQDKVLTVGEVLSCLFAEGLPNCLTGEEIRPIDESNSEVAPIVKSPDSQTKTEAESCWYCVEGDAGPWGPGPDAEKIAKSHREIQGPGPQPERRPRP